MDPAPKPRTSTGHRAPPISYHRGTRRAQKGQLPEVAAASAWWVRPPCPVRRVPLEILEEIFLFCLPAVRYIRPSATEAPLLLCSVCHLWREIDMAMPALWSSISVTVAHFHASADVVPFVEAWLARSRDHPLSLELKPFSDLDYPEIVLVANDILELFMKQPSRWKNIKWLLTDGLHEPLLRVQDDLRCPLLETFEFDTQGDVDWWSGILRSSPVLTRVYWVPLQSTLAQVRLPWAQLTSLELGVSLSVRDCIDVLGRCPAIGYCSLRDVWIPLFQPLVLEDRLLHKLRLLEIGTNQDVSALFDNLLLPYLQNFRIIYDNDPPAYTPWPQHYFLSFLVRSGCTLTSLTLTDTIISEIDLVQCLHWNTNSLLELCITQDGQPEHMCIRDFVLDLLTDRGGHELCLCHELEVIEFSYCVDAKEGALAEMLESRWWEQPAQNECIARIMRVKLKADELLWDDERRIEELAEDGLDVSVHRCTSDFCCDE